MPNLSNACSVTCKDFPKEIPPYSDIGGIGVTFAFIVTAWLIVAVLIGYYLKAFDPRLDPFREEDTQTPCKHPNAVDCSIHKMLRKIPGLAKILISDSARPSRLKAVLTDCVLMFADIQIFTAFAILISAFASLGCDIVAYHWQYMIYLAWLASVTHLASLSFLRNHLARNRVKCIWRLTAMAIIQVLLSVAVGLSTTFGQDPWLVGEGGRPAICYFRERPDKESVTLQSAIKMITLLIWGLSIRFAKMFEGFEGGLRRLASKLFQKSTKLRYGTEDSTTTNGLGSRAYAVHLRKLVVRPVGAAVLSMLAIQLDILTSFLAEAYWLLFSIIWITIRLDKLRMSGPQDDDKWTFGQILPLILLIAPLAIALEKFYTKTKNNISEIASTIDHNNIANSSDVTRDLQHIDTIAYRGAFFLAGLSYLEIGIYFILNQQASDGLITPLIQVLLLLLLFNPLLQITWITFETWMSQTDWGVPLKRACYDTVLQSFAATSLATNFATLISRDFLEYSQNSVFLNLLGPSGSILTLFNLGYFYFVLIFVLTAKINNARWAFIVSLVLLGGSFFATRSFIVAVYVYDFYDTYDIYWMLGYSAGFLVLLLINYGLQLWAERKHFSNWLVTCLTLILAAGIITLIMFYPGMVVQIPGALVFSFHICISVFMGLQFVSRRRQSNE